MKKFMFQDILSVITWFIFLLNHSGNDRSVVSYSIEVLYCIKLISLYYIM